MRIGSCLCDYRAYYLRYHNANNPSPSTLAHLQSILSISNHHSIPLWTFSRGKNLGYGGPAPRVTGCVALDLHRMNRILEINEQYAYAVVEPGVTFTDLYEEIRRRGLKVWPSVPSLGWGSVVGNVSFFFLCSGFEGVLGLERFQGFHRSHLTPLDARPRHRLHPHRDPPPAHLVPRNRPPRQHPPPHGPILRLLPPIPLLAPLQIHLRAQHRRPLPAIQPRHRHKNGSLAHARPRRLHVVRSQRPGL